MEIWALLFLFIGAIVVLSLVIAWIVIRLSTFVMTYCSARKKQKRKN